MFRTFSRRYLPNRLDWLCKRAAKRKAKTVLIAWNRGLGDIPLGLYAIVHRIRSFLPEAEITFMVRKDLQEGFSLFPEVKFLLASDWKRGEIYCIDIDPDDYDLVIPYPKPADWVRWQYGSLVPKLTWNPEYDSYVDRFSLPNQCVAIHVHAETNYGLWRNWPEERIREFLRLMKDQPILLLGVRKEPIFDEGDHIIDLRGETTLLELLAIVKNRCRTLIAPDSGILSMAYYLNTPFRIQVISLWGDLKHGILKQNVASPNPLLHHDPLIVENRDLSTLSAEKVVATVLPKRGVIILAGGEGSRCGAQGAKGMIPLLGKSLFQRICEKIGPHVPVAVMTSPHNHDRIVQFFKDHNNFSLEEITFFSQGMMPLLNREKEELEEQEPDGNGSLFQAFDPSHWEELGVELVHIVPVDNPIADPLDARLAAFHLKSDADLSFLSIELSDPQEPMGRLVHKEGRLAIVEFSELSSEERQQNLSANTGLYVCSLGLIRDLASKEFPIHSIWRSEAWKREKFITDALLFAQNPQSLSVSRNSCYAAIKETSHIPILERLFLEQRV